jgi:hypothetical protein
MRRMAPVYQALGGLTLALTCSSLGEHLGQWSGVASDPLEPYVDTVAGSTPIHQAAVRAMAPLSGCPGSSCESIAAVGAMFAGSEGGVPSVPVSGDVLGDASLQGQAMRVASAHDSSLPHASASAGPNASEPRTSLGMPGWPGLGMPGEPGAPWVEPLVTALLEPTAVEPIVIAVGQDPEAVPEPVVPHAGAAPGHPVDPQAAPEGLAAGTPSKRGGSPPSDNKPGDRAATPLPWNSPVGDPPPAGGPQKLPIDDPGTAYPPVPGLPLGPAPDGPLQWDVPPLGLPDDALNPILPLFHPSTTPDAIVSEPPDDTLPDSAPADLVVVAAIPEPTSLALFAVAAVALVGARRRRC